MTDRLFLNYCLVTNLRTQLLLLRIDGNESHIRCSNNVCDYFILKFLKFPLSNTDFNLINPIWKNLHSGRKIMFVWRSSLQSMATFGRPASLATWTERLKFFVQTVTPMTTIDCVTCVHAYDRLNITYLLTSRWSSDVATLMLIKSGENVNPKKRKTTGVYTVNIWEIYVNICRLAPAISTQKNIYETTYLEDIRHMILIKLSWRSACAWLTNSLQTSNSKL